VPVRGQQPLRGDDGASSNSEPPSDTAAPAAVLRHAILRRSRMCAVSCLYWLVSAPSSVSECSS
jgi:hypothetical protein